jgi:hypothetical protein
VGIRASKLSGIRATRSVATVIRNRIDQLIEIRQSHRRPSFPHLIMRKVPPSITAAKKAQTV